MKSLTASPINLKKAELLKKYYHQSEKKIKINYKKDTSEKLLSFKFQQKMFYSTVNLNFRVFLKIITYKLPNNFLSLSSNLK